MPTDFLSQGEVDALLGRVIPDNEDTKMIATCTDGENVCFSIPTGDWLYPSRDSTCGVQYPIDVPMALNLFATTEVIDLRRGSIAAHLKDHRRVHCVLNLPLNTVSLLWLTNDQEPDYKRHVETVLPITFDFETLARRDEFANIQAQEWGELAEGQWAIFVTSVVLQDYLQRPHRYTGNAEFTPSMRRATIPEIESFGRW